MARGLKCLWKIKDGRQFFLGELAAVLKLHRIVQYCLYNYRKFYFFYRFIFRLNTKTATTNNTSA